MKKSESSAIPYPLSEPPTLADAQDRARALLIPLTLKDELEFDLDWITAQNTQADLLLQTSRVVLAGLSNHGSLDNDDTYRLINLTGRHEYYLLERATSFRTLERMLQVFDASARSEDSTTSLFNGEAGHKDRNRYYSLLVNLHAQLKWSGALKERKVTLPDDTRHFDMLLNALGDDASEMTLRFNKGLIGREETLSWIKDTYDFIQNMKFAAFKKLRDRFEVPEYAQRQFDHQ